MVDQYAVSRPRPIARLARELCEAAGGQKRRSISIRQRTAALGLIYDDHKFQASVQDKIIGPQLASDGATVLPSYATVDASVSYDLGRVKLKLAAFNLADSRPRFDYDGMFSVYQVGRQIQGTIQVKY